MTIVPADLTHLPQLRMRFEELAAERRATMPEASRYPVVDGEGLDAFLYIMIEHLRNPTPDLHVLLALDGTDVIGFLVFGIMLRATAAPHRYGHGHWFYVIPAQRKQGIGRGLIASAVTWLREQGIAEVECEALCGDNQWADRGWSPYSVRWRTDLAQIAGWLAPKDTEKYRAEPQATVPLATFPKAVNGRRVRRRRERPSPSVTPDA